MRLEVALSGLYAFVPAETEHYSGRCHCVERLEKIPKART